MISEAKAFWDSISGKVKSLIRKETENAMRLQRYDVTTAPNGTVIGVTQPFGSNEIFLPYSKEVAGATVGDTVLVIWWGSMSNARVYYFAKGYDGGSGASVSPYDNTPANLGTAAAGTSDNYSRGNHVHAMPSASDVGAAEKAWTLISGSSTSSSQTVTYPAEATELLIKAKCTYSGGTIAYICNVPVDAIADISIIMLGGYYFGSSDYGLCNVNHSAANRTIALRNVRYAGTGATTGTVTVYWR